MIFATKRLLGERRKATTLIKSDVAHDVEVPTVYRRITVANVLTFSNQTLHCIRKCIIMWLDKKHLGLVPIKIHSNVDLGLH